MALLYQLWPCLPATDNTLQVFHDLFSLEVRLGDEMRGSLMYEQFYPVTARGVGRSIPGCLAGEAKLQFHARSSHAYAEAQHGFFDSPARTYIAPAGRQGRVQFSEGRVEVSALW